MAVKKRTNNKVTDKQIEVKEVEVEHDTIFIPAEENKNNIFSFIKKVYNKETLIELLKIFGIAYLVTFAWQQLELLIEGSIRRNYIDSIIMFILVLSLYGNFKIWEKK